MTTSPADNPAPTANLRKQAEDSSSPLDSEPERTIQWLAGNFDKGLTRVYALTIRESLVAGQQEQLADTAFEGIDQILQQARTLSREGNFFHVQCTRVGNQLVVLSDRDPRYDWILPAVQKRLRDELCNLHYHPAGIETQSLDMTCGQPLRFLDFELCCVQGKHGELRVHYRLLEETQRSPAGRAARWRWRYHPLRFLQPCVGWIGRQSLGQFVGDACGKIQAIQVGWRHLPITLFPVLLYFFGWQSPAPWLCLAAGLACNGRGIFDWMGRHTLDAVLAGCFIACLAVIYPSASEVYANLSRENAAADMPSGFYLGQYNKGSPWDAELVHYGLYVPPHLQSAKGPLPLIVFLHGYGQRTRARIFQAGLALDIAHQFGPGTANGPFEFVGFFPLDPTGQWQTGTPEVEDALMALDYVIKRHRIDPARVYLTGLSNGGNGVWRLAEAYPDKWAAVFPVSSFISPDVRKVRHIPAWIFHATKDDMAPVERERTLVRQLKEVQADVRYTEIPNAKHTMRRGVYDVKALYDWLATKKKG